MIKERIPISGDLGQQGQAADGVRRMAGRTKSGHLHCGEVLRRSWRPDDEDHPAVLPQSISACAVSGIWSKKN